MRLEGAPLASVADGPRLSAAGAADPLAVAIADAAAGAPVYLLPARFL